MGRNGKPDARQLYYKLFGARLDDDQAVKTWRQRHPKHTYLAGLRKFCVYLEMTPSQIIELREKQIGSKDRKERFFFENKVVEFYGDLQAKQGLSKNSAKATTVPVRSFFNWHRLDLSLRRGEITTEQVVDQDYHFRNGDFIKMAQVAQASRRNLTLLLFGAQTGLSVADAVGQKKELWLAKIRRALDPETVEDKFPIVIETRRQKDKIRQWACIWNDAGKAILEYHKELEAEGIATEWLFIVKDTPFRHLPESQATRIIQRLATLAHIDIPAGKRVRFHCLRKFHYNRCRSRMKDSYMKQVQGRSLGAEEAYASDEDIRKEYMKTRDLLNTEAAVAGKGGRVITDEDYKLLKTFKNVLEIYDSMKATAVQAADTLDPQIREYAEVKSPLLDAVLLAKAFKAARNKGED